MASTATFNGVLCYVDKPITPTNIDRCVFCNRALLAMTANNDWDVRNCHLACYERETHIPKREFRRLVRLIRERRFPVVMSATHMFHFL